VMRVVFFLRAAWCCRRCEPVMAGGAVVMLDTTGVLRRHHHSQIAELLCLLRLDETVVVKIAAGHPITRQTVREGPFQIFHSLACGSRRMQHALRITARVNVGCAIYGLRHCLGMSMHLLSSQMGW